MGVIVKNLSDSAEMFRAEVNLQITEGRGIPSYDVTAAL